LGSSVRVDAHIVKGLPHRPQGLPGRGSGPDDLVRVLIALGIGDERLLDAFRAVPRDAFVPAELKSRAYRDEPLPIPHGQVTTQPSLTAKMIEALDLDGHERVLEIGTGYGFQTALLARLAETVWSVERWADVAATARTHLERRGVANAHVVAGDGTAGLPARAPFDAILVSAAFTRVPEPLAEQLAPQGRLVQPVGPGGHEEVVRFVKEPDGLRRDGFVTWAYFVRLVGEHGFRE
jgi:protein-L-isoaspartate(D-aspartate) O-methyltransferase